MLLWNKVAFLAVTAMTAGLAIIILLSIPAGGYGGRLAHGVVLDQTKPIAGAVVRIRGREAYVLTSERGEFRLPVPAAENDAQLTAWAPGYFVAGRSAADFTNSDGSSLMLRRHPTSDNTDYEFISPLLDTENPTACAHCHQTRDGKLSGVLPVDEWLLDAHSGSATNERFLSLYNGTTVEGRAGVRTAYQFSEAQGMMVPMPPAAGADLVGPGFRLDFPEQSGSCATCHVPVLAVQDPYRADPNQATGVAREGVTCDFCHKIQNVRVGLDGLPNRGLPGVLSIDFLRPEAGEQVFIGPFDDTPGDDIYSQLQNESLVCAACHTGRFWDVEIYNSFGEWLDSPYSDPNTGSTCQDCHMPHTGTTAFALLPPDDPLVLPPRDPDTIFSHRMPGAADQELLNNTVSLAVETERTSDRLKVIVRITNTGAGHHVPTDSPLRNLILWVRPVDSAGQALALTQGPVIPAWGGEGDPESGYYAGQPGMLYAKVLADFYTGEVPTYAYWRQTRLVSDNRIPALATDESAYEFALPVNSGPVRVEVRVYLRRAFIDLMDLKGWNVPDILMEQSIVDVP
jgi:hypothetical protein